MISEHYTPEAVILANGEYPTHVLPLKILEEAKFVICCDGAANEYILRSILPILLLATEILFRRKTKHAFRTLFTI